MGCGSCGGSEPTGTQTVTTTNEPWKAIQPYLTGLAGAAQNLYNSPPPQYYPGSTVAPFSPQQEMAMNLTTGRALQGSPLNEAAQGSNLATMGGAYLNGPASGFLQGQMSHDPTINPYTSLMGSTAAGGFLNGNPWLDQTFDRAASAVSRNYAQGVLPGIDSAAVGAGRYGSGLWSNERDNAYDQLGRSLEGMAGSLYGNNYQAERDRMMGAASGIQGAYDTSLNRGLSAAGQANQGYQAERNNMMAAMGMAPSLAQTDYADFDKLMGVGNTIQQQAQNRTNDMMNRWNFSQGLPEQMLNQYANVINPMGGMGSAGTQTSPMYGGSGLQNMLGAGMTIAGLASGNPMMAAGGASSCCPGASSAAAMPAWAAI